MKNIIYLIFVVFQFIGCSSKQKQDIPMTEVKKGLFQLEITEEGEVNATRSITIVSPNVSYRYGELKITEIVEDGIEVSKGDTLLVFDPSQMKKAIVDAENRIESNKAEMEKMLAQHTLAIEELEADYKISKIDQQISEIRFEASDYEADIKKKEIKLNLDKANIALNKAKDEIENKKKIQFEEVQQEKLEMEQAQAELNDAYFSLNKLFLIAPSDGIAILKESWGSDTKFQVGDQVWTGYPMIELPDLSELMAEVKVNEVDVSKIKKGGKVIIQPDAFSDSVYYGEVSTIANLAVNKDRNSKIKVFPIEILINGTGQHLMPGLTVSCKIIIDEIEDVVYIPLEALQNDGISDFVYLKSGAGFKRRNIETGLANNDYIIVTNGLKQGDKLALVDPFVHEEDQEESTTSN